MIRNEEERFSVSGFTVCWIDMVCSHDNGSVVRQLDMPNVLVVDCTLIQSFNYFTG